MADTILNKKAQGILETTFTLIIVLLLLGGIINIWLWANTQIVRRQIRYNASRISAAHPLTITYSNGQYTLLRN
jgi:hypothetical protein